MHPSRLLPPSVCLVLLSCVGTAPKDSPVPGLVAEGSYARAVEVAEARYRRYPDDPTAEDEYRAASVALQLERARRATFDDRDEEALALLDDAELIDPGNPQVASWRLKTERKLSTRWLDNAQEFASRQELANALEAFDRALAYDPTNTAAEQGRIRMLLLMNYREGVGEAYFKEGVRAMRKYALHQARVKFEYTSEKYSPGHEEAKRRELAVERLLAEESVEKAREFEAQGKYFAAGNEYRIALLLDPDSADAEEGRRRMELEMGAKERLDHADWLRLRGRFDEARDAIAEGQSMTELQEDAFASKAIDIEQEEHGLLYEEALRLERDFQYERAIEAYGALLDIAGYYEDAITRRSTLEGFVEQSEELYAAAMATDDVDEKIALLRQVQLIWPEYRDVPELLHELESAEPAAPEEPAPSEATDESDVPEDAEDAEDAEDDGDGDSDRE